MSNPFAKGTPSIFVVSSPFQVISTIAAIRNLDIGEYKVYVFPSTHLRNLQEYNILDDFGIKYEVVSLSRLVFRIYRLLCFLPFVNKYKRLFVGYHRAVMLHYIGLMHVSSFSDIVYLDDGSESISTFMSPKIINYWRWERPILKTACFFRGISLKRRFYSVYTGIKNPNYDIVENRLSGIFLGTKTRDQSEDIVFIGTFLEAYCDSLRISIKQMYDVMGRIFNMLNSKYGIGHVVYIPHGRDNDKNIRLICKQYGVKYQKINRPIEIEFIMQDTYPHAMYGFTSSALYSLKKMFPNIDAYNIVDDLAGNLDYNSISEYYKSQDIKELLVSKIC